MRVHSEGFRNQIIEMGREIDSIITYTIDDETIELGAEQLNSITPSFQGSILKSAMKQLIIDTNADIPRGTEINYKFGLKVNGEYEYIDFGNYIVEKSTKKEDTRSYEIECYDAMIKTMVDYEDMALVYPISVRDYLNEISAYFNFTFKNINDEFTNYDKLIPSDLYLSADGTSLGYTFRDVLDELAQVTGSTICISNDGELEVRYINDTGITLNEEFFNDVNVNIGEKYGKVNSIVLSRSGESDNVFLKDDASIEANGLCEIKITDNQIMNDNNRADFLPALAERLFGLEYYINELSLKGAIFLELCDRYDVSIFGETYSCVMLNDEIIVSQGIQENVFTERLDGTETDYKSSSDDDRKINKAFIMVNKQNQTIEALAESVKEIKAGVVTSKTIEGNPIHITDAGAYDLEKLYLEGNSYQEGTPTPDTPQEIEVIEGSVDVEVVGKNLLPISALSSRTTNGITFTNNNDGTYTLKGTATNLTNLLLFDQNNANLKLKSNQYYTLSVKVLSGEVNFSIPSAIKDNEGKITYNYMTLATPTKLTDKEYDFYQISLYITSGKVVDCTIALQIEESSTATEYEEHKSTTATIDLQGNFLAKIGDVKDEIDVVTGKLTKRIGKVVLNGSENWLSASSVVEGTSRFYYDNSNVYNEILSTSTKIYVISDKFVNTYWRGIYDGDKINKNLIANYNDRNNRNGRIVIRIDNNYASSVATFKTWLASNNVTVYYALAEPYEVQLDTNSIRLFKGINNISINANLEPSYVSLTYLVDNAWNSQYATKSQLEVTQNNINSVVKDTTTLNANLTDLQALVSVENTNLKNALGDLSNNLEENYATNNSVLTIENSVSNIQTSLNQQIEITKEIQVNGVSKVKTTTGFTFDENGMTITKTNADTKTNIDEDGMVVYSTTGAENTEILVADAQGVKAENVQVKTWLVVGENSRFQDYSTGTGCFWIGK